MGEILPELMDYAFDLPLEQVAQSPPPERGLSRLMVVDRGRDQIHEDLFDRLPLLLPAKALLVFNQVRVTQARLLGRRVDTGGKTEAFILEPPAPGSGPGDYDLWCLVHPGRRVKPGARFAFEHPDTDLVLEGEALEIHPDGRRFIRFRFPGDPEEILSQVGHVPLPFYIKRPDAREDRDRYQTVYARTPGAVAAPTAGLHFTKVMLERLAQAGFESAEVTLKVGAGTFSSLTARQLETGRLHREHITVPEATVAAVARAKAEGRPVVAVGTTTVRSLEWAALDGELTAAEGWGDLFIWPGFQFRVVDGLVTNFHLPASSLLMLVSALAGRERIMAAYARAVESGFRFYSYGDAMLIV